MITNTQAKYRHALPQLQGGWFLTDGGLETTLVFHDGIDLPYFAACDMLKEPAGIKHLKAYYEPYIEQAKTRGAGFILESATWRAHPDFGEKLGYTPQGLADLNRLAIGMLEELRETHETERMPMVISGCIGPRANASCKSHEELDNSEELDVGNPEELGQQYQEMLGRMNHVNILGGCCGTDHRHIDAIGRACADHFRFTGEYLQT